MYWVLKKLRNGEFTGIAFRDDFAQAAELVKGLALWVGGYVVRDSEGIDIDIEEVQAKSEES